MAAKLSLGQINSAFASVAIKDESGQALAINASGHITIANTSFGVTGSGSGFRDLSSGLDSISAVVTAMPTVTVTATDLDIRDLSHTQDSLKIGDGTDFLAINADGSINVNGSFGGSGSSSWQNSLVSLTASTAAELAATPLSGRTSMTVQNLSSRDIWLGPDNTVTDTGATHGLVLPKGTSMDIPLTDSANIFAYSDGAADLLVSEFN